jgi:hypothetical protein
MENGSNLCFVKKSKKYMENVGKSLHFSILKLKLEETSSDRVLLQCGKVIQNYRKLCNFMILLAIWDRENPWDLGAPPAYHVS